MNLSILDRHLFSWVSYPIAMVRFLQYGFGAMLAGLGAFGYLLFGASEFGLLALITGAMSSGVSIGYGSGIVEWKTPYPWNFYYDEPL